MKIWVIVFSAMALCTACTHPQQLKITDLKFGDVEKEALVRNEVDTMFLLSGNSIINLPSNDTIGYQTYDASGNLLIQHQTIAPGNKADFEYDSIGLLRHKSFVTNHLAQYNLAYNFNPDSLTLQQFWTGKTNDTSLFRFDKNGNLLETTDCSDTDSWREFRYKVTYTYNSIGQMIQKKRELLADIDTLKTLENDYGMHIVKVDTTDFFYVDNRLDTAITAFYYPTHPGQNYTSKTYYNDRGLREVTVSKYNTITRYVYSTRNND